MCELNTSVAIDFYSIQFLSMNIYHSQTVSPGCFLKVKISCILNILYNILYTRPSEGGSVPAEALDHFR